MYFKSMATVYVSISFFFFFSPQFRNGELVKLIVFLFLNPQLVMKQIHTHIGSLWALREGSEARGRG